MQNIYIPIQAKIFKDEFHITKPNIFGPMSFPGRHVTVLVTILKLSIIKQMNTYSKCSICRRGLVCILLNRTGKKCI